jgi:hypothetical protein
MRGKWAQKDERKHFPKDTEQVAELGFEPWFALKAGFYNQPLCYLLGLCPALSHFETALTFVSVCFKTGSYYAAQIDLELEILPF